MPIKIWMILGIFPFSKNSSRVSSMYIPRNIPDHRLEWSELPISGIYHEYKGFYYEEFTLHQLNGDLWGTFMPPRNYKMLLMRFREPTQLDRITLRTISPTWKVVFEEDLIFSIDFMGYKIYGISLDLGIKGWKDLAEEITRQIRGADEGAGACAGADVGLSIPAEFLIELEAYPKSIPEIKLI